MIIALLAMAHGAEMTLDTAMAQAADRPAVHAASYRADAARAHADGVWAATVLPSLDIEAGATRSQVVNLETPYGTLPQTRASDLAAGAKLTVPLIVPHHVFVEGPAASRAAGAARSGSDRERALRVYEAADTWLRVRELDARSTAANTYVTALRQRHDAAVNLEAEGAGLHADTLRLDSALAGAEQEVAALGRARDVAALQLGHAVGSSEPVEPVGEVRTEPVPALDALLEASSRPDVRALQQTLEAERRLQSGAWTHALPTIALVGQWTSTDTEALDRNAWTEASVVAVWRPLDKGRRLAETRVRTARVRALRHDLIEANRGVELEIRAAYSAVENARDAIVARGIALERATEAARIIRDRYDAGLTPLTDVLSVEAELRAQHTAVEVARLDAVRARHALDLAVGH
jgi:outer membrane protein TolC